MILDSGIRQQKLPAWRPICTSRNVIPIVFITGAIFIPIGFILVLVSNSVREFELEYGAPCYGKECQRIVPFQLKEPFMGDVYFFYGLHNYFQNNRRYMKSRSDKQLLGNLKTSEVSECYPYDKVNDSSGVGITIAPCGAVANSMFNDTFWLRQNIPQQNTTILVPWTYSDLPWPLDKGVKFKNPTSPTGSLCNAFEGTVKPPNWGKRPCELDTSNPDNNGFLNVDFIIWMRTAALPDFRKPYRKLDRSKNPNFSNGLPAGEYLLSIENNYPVSVFSGKKSFIISTSSWNGGKNSLLGISYIVVGAFSILLGVIFIIIHIKFGHRLADIGGISELVEHGQFD